MKRPVLALSAVIVAAALAAVAARSTGATPGLPAGAGTGEVAIFYYPWYGTPTRDGSWQHWQQHGNEPPAKIASQWYPARGPYSSTDPLVLGEQMQEIAAAGVQTVIVSWWGPGSVEAARLPAVQRAARVAGLRVALHVEPYAGRDPATLAPIVRSFAAQGVRDFYIYDSATTPDPAWHDLNTSLSGVRLFANTGLAGKAETGGFAGLYTYDTLVYGGNSFRRVCATARMHGLVCAPSVGPGYNAGRATGDPRVKPRRNGATYDRIWAAAIRASADVVTITSYNEWHEGTQIEPARTGAPGYASYEGAYGRHGPSAQRAYLDRTALWSSRYRERVGR